MQFVDTLLHCRWLIPMTPDDAVREYHSLAVSDDKIVAILPQDDARQRFQARTTVDLPNHAVLPGLINAHTHAAMTLMRGMADDLPLMTWLNEHIWPVEQQVVAADFVRVGTDLALWEMLRAGITCCNDMYFFPDAAQESATRLGFRLVAGLIVLDFPSAWASGPDEYLAKALEHIERYRGRPRAHFALAPHAPYTVSEATLTRVGEFAEHHDLPIHIHVHETADEVERALASNGERPLAALQRLGLLSPRLIAVHMTQLLDEEIALAGQTGLHIVHCPESNLKLASGLCPVQRLTAAGVNIAIGTDGAASNNDLDIIGEMRSAALLGKIVASDAAALPAASVLRMATINAARALGLDDRIGSLTVGKHADMIAIDLHRPATQPVYDPISQIVYSASRDQVSHVWIDGRSVLSDHELVDVDVDALNAEITHWSNRIRQLRTPSQTHH